MHAVREDFPAGYQVKGTVTHEDSGERYEYIAAQVREILSGMGYDYYSKGVCWLHVEEVYSITPGQGTFRERRHLCHMRAKSVKCCV